MSKNTEKLEVEVYLDDGRVAFYEVDSEEKAREHIGAIIKGGWRSSNQDGSFEWYPPHRIVKCKVQKGLNTKYPTQYRGT